jgi:hypothetical protein
MIDMADALSLILEWLAGRGIDKLQIAAVLASIFHFVWILGRGRHHDRRQQGSENAGYDERRREVRHDPSTPHDHLGSP